MGTSSKERNYFIKNKLPRLLGEAISERQRKGLSVAVDLSTKLSIGAIGLYVINDIESVVAPLAFLEELKQSERLVHLVLLVNSAALTSKNVTSETTRLTEDFYLKSQSYAMDGIRVSPPDPAKVAEMVAKRLHPAA